MPSFFSCSLRLLLRSTSSARALFCWYWARSASSCAGVREGDHGISGAGAAAGLSCAASEPPPNHEAMLFHTEPPWSGSEAETFVHVLLPVLLHRSLEAPSGAS